MTGTIAKLIPEKFFGFIAADDRIDYFFHASSVRGVPFTDVAEGHRVTFDREASERGPRACNVRALAD